MTTLNSMFPIDSAAAFIVAARLNFKYKLGHYSKASSPQDGLAFDKVTKLNHTSATGRLRWNVALGGNVEIEVTKPTPGHKMSAFLDTRMNVMMIAANAEFGPTHMLAMVECALAATDSPKKLSIIIEGESRESLEYALKEVGYESLLARITRRTDPAVREEAIERQLANGERSTN